MWPELDSRLQAIASLLLLSGFTGAGESGQAEPRHLTVSAGRVTGSDEDADQDANYFAERIGMGRNFRGRRVRNCSWNETPKGCVPESHVNVLRLRFRDRLELLAMMFDANGAVALAARAPALFQRAPFFTYRLSPGDYQWPGNAPNDLVANFVHAMERRSRSRGAYRLIAKPWKQEEQAGNVDAAVVEEVLTLDKRLQVLDLARLEQEAALRFPFRLHPQVLAVNDFPQRRPPWLLGLLPDGAKVGDLSEQTTGCLLSDIKGKVFVLSGASDR